MEIRKFLLGQQEFLQAGQIAEAIRQSRNFDSTKEDPTLAATLLIFQTSYQQTWLVATRERLYCVLDDLKKSFTRVQWSMARDGLISNGQVSVSIATRDKTDRSGLLDIGEHKGWLFSKKLFADTNIESATRGLISQQMLP